MAAGSLQQVQSEPAALGPDVALVGRVHGRAQRTGERLGELARVLEHAADPVPTRTVRVDGVLLPALTAHHLAPDLTQVERGPGQGRTGEGSPLHTRSDAGRAGPRSGKDGAEQSRAGQSRGAARHGSGAKRSPNKVRKNGRRLWCTA